MQRRKLPRQEKAEQVKGIERPENLKFNDLGETALMALGKLFGFIQ